MDDVASHSLKCAPTSFLTAGTSAPCACGVRTSTCDSDIADTTWRRPATQDECIGDAITSPRWSCGDAKTYTRSSRYACAGYPTSLVASVAVCALRSELSHYHISPRSHILCRPILSHHVHVMVNAHPRVHPIPTHEIPMPRTFAMRTSCPELGREQIRSEHIISHRRRVASHRVHVELGYPIPSKVVTAHPPSSMFLHSASPRFLSFCPASPRLESSYCHAFSFSPCVVP